MVISHHVLVNKKQLPEDQRVLAQAQKKIGEKMHGPAQDLTWPCNTPSAALSNATGQSHKSTSEVKGKKLSAQSCPTHVIVEPARESWPPALCVR